MLARLRYRISDLRYRARYAGWTRVVLTVLGVLALVVAAAFAVIELSGSSHTTILTGQAAGTSGYPAEATKNTTRVAGADPTADAASVALATFPPAGGIEQPAAVTVVPSDNWPGGVAASVLAAPPVSAPVLLSSPNSVPEQTTSALTTLAPPGSKATGGAQAFRIGNAGLPEGLRSTTAPGNDPATLAGAIDQLHQRLTGEGPAAVVIASTADPSFAMPAAAWAARSGDPVLFVDQNAIPKPTLLALKRDKPRSAYLLGPSSVSSDQVLADIKKLVPNVTRIQGPDPVTNAIAFARFHDGSFGWNIIDPGHGLVIENTSRPLDAAAAAPLSGRGTWGPLLLTDTANAVPPPLRSYLLDIKPGYVDDPTRAFYNHAWLIGDTATISVNFQAQVDDLLEVAKVQSGSARVPPNQ